MYPDIIFTTAATDSLLSDCAPDALFRLRPGRNGHECATDEVRLLVQLDEDGDTEATLEIAEGRFGNAPSGFHAFTVDPRTDARALAALLDNADFAVEVNSFLHCSSVGLSAQAIRHYSTAQSYLTDLPHFETATA